MHRLSATQRSSSSAVVIGQGAGVGSGHSGGSGGVVGRSIAARKRVVRIAVVTGILIMIVLMSMPSSHSHGDHGAAADTPHGNRDAAIAPPTLHQRIPQKATPLSSGDGEGGGAVAADINMRAVGSHAALPAIISSSALLSEDDTIEAGRNNNNNNANAAAAAAAVDGGGEPLPSLSAEDQYRSMMRAVVGDMLAVAEDRQSVREEAVVHVGGGGGGVAPTAKGAGSGHSNNNNRSAFSRRIKEPLVISVLCACGGGGGLPSPSLSFPPSLYQSICEEAVRSVSSGSITTLLVNDLHMDAPAPAPTQSRGGDRAEESSPSSVIDPSLPFWGSTDPKLRAKIAAHAQKMLGLANKASSQLTLPPLRDGSSARHAVGHVPPAALQHLFFGGGGGRNGDHSSDGAERDYGKCGMPSLEGLLADSHAAGGYEVKGEEWEQIQQQRQKQRGEGAGNKEEKASSSSSSSSSSAHRIVSDVHLLTPSQRVSVRYDAAIVCAEYTTRLMKKDSDGTHATAAMFVKRLLAQSAATYMVVAPPLDAVDGAAPMLGKAKGSPPPPMDVEILNLVSENIATQQGSSGERSNKQQVEEELSAAGPLLECSSHAVSDDAEEGGDSDGAAQQGLTLAAAGGGRSVVVHRPRPHRAVSRVECGVVASSAAHFAHCMAHSGASAVGVLPPRCGDVLKASDGVTIKKIVKLGTKTGIYAGVYGGGEEDAGGNNGIAKKGGEEADSDASSSSLSSSSSHHSPVIVKHFAALQYAQFAGFHAYMSATSGGGSGAGARGGGETQKALLASPTLPLPAAYPLIVAPSHVCYEEQSNTVFQLQHHVQDAVNLKKLMQRERERARDGVGVGQPMPMSAKLQIAIQIVCIFDYLHTKHPSGHVFSFDDNHPEQYIITKSKHYVVPSWMRKERKSGERSSPSSLIDANGYFKGTFYEVRMIDIDTLQLAVPKKSALRKKQLAEAKEGGGAAPLALTDYQTKCRCFFCRGRSNCLFINTEEGYEACGQSIGNDASGDSEAAAVVPPLPPASDDDAPTVVNGVTFPPLRCNPSSDVWFLGQLLYYIGTMGRVPYEDSSMSDVIRKIKRRRLEDYPQPRTEDEVYNRLVGTLFLTRPPTGEILETLFGLCDKYGCGFESHQCPAAVANTHPYHDLIDLSRIVTRV